MTTTAEIFEMIDRLEHKGPESQNWHVAMIEAAALLRKLAEEREAQESLAAFGQSMARLPEDINAVILDNVEGLYEK